MGYNVNGNGIDVSVSSNHSYPGYRKSGACTASVLEDSAHIKPYTGRAGNDPQRCRSKGHGAPASPAGRKMGERNVPQSGQGVKCWRFNTPGRKGSTTRPAPKTLSNCSGPQKQIVCGGGIGRRVKWGGVIT